MRRLLGCIRKRLFKGYVFRRRRILRLAERLVLAGSKTPVQSAIDLYDAFDKSDA